MKIIISENQNSLLRRYSTIKNEVYNHMDPILVITVLIMILIDIREMC
jgi:hypothetical protein